MWGITGIRLPRQVFLNSELSAREKILFGLIDTLRGKGCGYCREDNETLAVLLNLKTKNPIKIMLLHLQKLEYIFVEYENVMDGNGKLHKNRIIGVVPDYLSRYSNSTQIPFKEGKK